MLYTQTVHQKTLELLKMLMADPQLNSFVLAGGTALSLQIGHRVSVDLDFFTNTPFDEQKILEHLHNNYNFELDFLDKETIKGVINDIKVDLIAHKYPYVKSVVTTENIRLLSLYDIAAMKLNAIVGNGSRLKDFVDIANLFHHITLQQMLDAFHKKYNTNQIMVCKALVYFDDINFQEPIILLDQKFDWKKIKSTIVKNVK